MTNIIDCFAGIVVLNLPSVQDITSFSVLIEVCLDSSYLVFRFSVFAFLVAIEQEYKIPIYLF